MNIRSTATFIPGNIAKVLEDVTARNLRATTKASEVVRDAAKERSPTKTGFMQSEIYSETILEGQAVTGSVVSPAPYSVYVEYGVRQLGAAGEWAGDFDYSEGKGFAGFGMMRGALDESESAILQCYTDEGFKM